ncbi:MAG: TIGR02266 family protein [Deltaproteobacteria bacterium]|nr:TIGR02266 family protein [Deltaproteobacteria bacterium]
MSDQRKPPASDRRLDERVPTQVRVRLKYPDVETFLERYATNISHGGIFIQTQRTKPAGTLIRFEFQLQDASPVIRGEGRVSWVVPYDPAHAERAYGMGVKFTKLDGRSKTYIDRVVAQKLKRGQPDDASAPPSPEIAELGPVRDVSPPESAGASRRTPPRAAPVVSAPAEFPEPVVEPKRTNGRRAPSEQEIAELLATPLATEIKALVEKVLGKPRLEPAAAEEVLAQLEREVGPIPPRRRVAAPEPREVAPRPDAMPAAPPPDEVPAARTAAPSPTASPRTAAPGPTASPTTPRPWVRRTPAPPVPRRADPVAPIQREPTPTPVVDPTEAVVAPPDTGAELDSGLAPAPVPATAAVPTPAPVARPQERIDRILEEAVPEGSFELDLDGLGADDDTGIEAAPKPRESPQDVRTATPLPSPEAAPETIPASVPAPRPLKVPEPHAGLAEPATEATDPALALPATEHDMPIVGTEEAAWDQITVVPDGNEPGVTPGDRAPIPRSPLELTPVDPAIHVADLGAEDPAFSMDDAPLIEEGESGLAERTVIGGSVFDFLSATGRSRVDDALARARDRNLEVTATHPPLEVPESEGSSSDAEAMFGLDVELPPDAGAQQGLPILDEPLVDDFGLSTDGAERAPSAQAARMAAPAEPIVDEGEPVGEPVDVADVEIGLEPTAAQQAVADDMGNEATTAAPVLEDAFVYAQTVQAQALADAFEPTLAHEPLADSADDEPAPGHAPFPYPLAALEEGTLREAALPELPASQEEPTPVASTDTASGPDAQKKGFFRKLFGNK